MTLDEIVLENFGVYQGRQSLSLTPPSPDQPIVLIGGLNGGGKTTLLNALRLGLYGERARLHSKGQRYQDYLAGLIHRSADFEKGAGLEIAFRYSFEARQHAYRVHRFWTPRHGGVKERVEVWKDGFRDDVLTDCWAQLVEEFIPSRIAPLFFFDGERIEALADPEQSSQVLSEAVHSLLGIDLLDQLGTDLRLLERRKRRTVGKPNGKGGSSALEEELDALGRLRQDLVQAKAKAKNRLQRAEKKRRQIEDRYRREGGELYEQRHALEAQRRLLAEQLDQVQEELRHQAAGPAPLLLVRDLLDAVSEQDQKEQAAEQAKAVSQVLLKRDRKTLKLLQRAGASGETLDPLRTFLKQDRADYRKASGTDRHLNLSPRARARLERLQGGLLDETAQRIRTLTGESERLQSSLLDLDRKLAGVPTPESLESLLAERADLEKEQAQAESRLTALQSEIDQLARRIEEKQRQLARQMEEQAKRRLGHQDAARTIEHSQKVRGTLDRFRQTLLRRHLGRLESFILESFQMLLHKQRLVSSLTIDPETFRVELGSPDGNPLPAERLSAGERQLLAVSLLWGLARASGRPLPTVIDTPLGRLDSAHRNHLVERYFPFASHQVLLLSTDEEIDDSRRQQLDSSIGHSYLLSHSDEKGATQAQPGYFNGSPKGGSRSD